MIMMSYRTLQRSCLLQKTIARNQGDPGLLKLLQMVITLPLALVVPLMDRVGDVGKVPTLRSKVLRSKIFRRH
jgi:hypothetical protein